jgi:hypothetical protein
MDYLSYHRERLQRARAEFLRQQEFSEVVHIAFVRHRQHSAHDGGAFGGDESGLVSSQDSRGPLSVTRAAPVPPGRRPG